MLTGKSLVVTGASQGLGKGLAVAAGSAGAKVVVTALDQDAAEAVAEEIRSRGGEAIGCRCDVTDRAQVTDAVAKTLERFGRLDALIHNAISGFSGRDVALQDATDENWNEQVAVGLRGAFYCAQAGFPALRDAGGTFILMVSNGGIEGSMARPIYAAVKGAQRGLLKSLAREWGPSGVRVNGIAPVGLTPGMSETFKTRPELRQYIQFGSSLGRIGDPEHDIGAALNFLVGPDSAFMTGQTLLLNGGTTML